MKIAYYCIKGLSMNNALGEIKDGETKQEAVEVILAHKTANICCLFIMCKLPF